MNTTISYLHAMCELVIRETSLMPHVNAGVDVATGDGGLRDVSVSQGIMLETRERKAVRKRTGAITARPTSILPSGSKYSHGR